MPDEFKEKLFDVTSPTGSSPSDLEDDSFWILMLTMSDDISLIHLGETSTTAMDSPSFEFTAERAIDLIRTGAGYDTGSVGAVLDQVVPL